MFTLLSSYIRPLVEKNIDYLVLGCSHYPYLIPVLKKILPKNIIIIDSGEAVARQTKVILSNNDLLNENASEGSHIFFTNGRLSVLQNILKKTNITTDANQLEF